MKKKHTMTLLEIMIVIVIIGIIGSVMGYNMHGSLDQGRAFKTKEAARKLYEIILLEEAITKSQIKDMFSKNNTDAICQEVQEIVKRSELVRQPKELIRDGWGNIFTFTYDDEKDEIRYFSSKYNAYCEKKGMKPEYPWTDEDRDTTLH